MAQAPNVSYSGPLVITQGGTYSGNYRSTNSSVPVITIQTTQPVIIENSILAGAGNIIDAKNGGSSLTIRNNRAYGLAQSADNTRHGRFAEVNAGRSVTIEHNYFEQTTGIDIYRWGGNGTAQQTLTVRYNSAKNMDGRYRNGGGTFCNFIGMNGATGMVGAEIAWNQIINLPNQSYVEDNVNFYNSGGTSGSWVQVHDNYIFGSYPPTATASSHTGTGFIIDGDPSSTPSGYVRMYNNQVISTCGAGMNIAAGHDIEYSSNRIISAGLMADGTRLNANWAAVAVWNAYGQASFGNNIITNNLIGYYSQGGGEPYNNRRDNSPGACATCPGNTHLPDRPLTLADEQAEWTLWLQKLQQNNVTPGVSGSGTGTTPVVTPPTVSLSAPGTGVVGTALALAATAASSGSTVAKVEFFNGSTKLGEDLTAPYTLSYVPTAAGTLALTVRATDAAGNGTTSSATNVTVTAAATNPGTSTPGTPANSTFFRAFNLGGSATTIDGRNWEAGSGVANFSVNGSSFSNQNVTLNPATDAARANMIRSSVYSYGTPISGVVSNVTNGTYSVYVYVWEDNNAETYSLTLEGQTVQANYNSGAAGHWDRLGPFTANIIDGNINVGATGNGANLSGIEIWKQNTTAPVVTPPTVSLSAPGTGVVGTALALSASAASSGSTVAKVEFYNGSTKLGEDLTAPYTLSYVPTAAGTLSLTARATDAAGNATTSAAANVTVTAAPTAPVFLRAINLGGGAITLDGHAWAAGSSAPNFRATGVTTFANQSVTLTPATDATRASMIRSSMYGNNPSLSISGIANGTYSVYLYVWEDNGAETFNITLEGRTVQSSYNSGATGHWDRLGPFTTTITDGAIDLGTTGGTANLSGIEIWQRPSASL
jgi:hypothetical protein